MCPFSSFFFPLLLLLVAALAAPLTKKVETERQSGRKTSLFRQKKAHLCDLSPTPQHFLEIINRDRLLVIIVIDVVVVVVVDTGHSTGAAAVLEGVVVEERRGCWRMHCRELSSLFFSSTSRASPSKSI